MILIKPSYQILTPLNPAEMLKRIEAAGRTCYKSEDKITKGSAEKFIKSIINRGHESVIEHESLSVRFICDRGVTHEIVRHRLASFSQESTRYVSSTINPKLVAENDLDIIELYNLGHSMRKISKMSSGKYTEHQIYKILDDNDIKRRPIGNHGLRNQTAFKHLDSPEKAYLMGLFIADGSIRRDLSQVSVTQHQDYAWYIGVMLRTILGSEVGCYVDKDCVQFNFSGKEIGVDLFNNGLTPNKSYDTTRDDVERLKSAIPEHLIPDFLRGLMDGDGCIRFFNQREDSLMGSANLTFSGNHFVMTWVAELMKTLIGYDAYVRKDPDAELSRVIITHKPSVMELCKLMFKNFKMPFGHPKKCVRIFDEIPDICPIAWESWGDPKFQVIEPLWLTQPLTESSWVWAKSMDSAESSYSKLRNLGWKPEQARSVLPNSLKTEIVVTANLREWRTIFKQRAISGAAHPQIREIMIPLYNELRSKLPAIFDDLGDPAPMKSYS